MRLTLVCLLIVVLAGCTPSLSPLYTESDKLFDPALLGEWKEADGSDKFVAARRGEVEYRVLHTAGGWTEAFTARLIELGPYRFLDLFPESRYSGNEFHSGHFIPTHTFGRIRLEGDRLSIALLDPDWCEKQAPAAIGFTKVADTDLLVAPTARLREFALKHAETDAFGAITKWIRKP